MERRNGEIANGVAAASLVVNEKGQKHFRARGLSISKGDSLPLIDVETAGGRTVYFSAFDEYSLLVIDPSLVEERSNVGHEIEP